ncbi:MAG: hypothetical protein IT240_06780 [Bacteroidia bacterium]|nr:hypothetical protein [Bacteroidia bacterium]
MPAIDLRQGHENYANFVSNQIANTATFSFPLSEQELKTILTRVVWDYYISPDELLAVFYGEESSKGVNQVQLYAKLLNAYSWHQLIKWFGFEKARTILREEAIQMVFPASYRQKLLNAKFLTTQALSDTDFTRVFVAENGTALKIEFINDVAFHYGDFVYHGKIKTDNPLNVLSKS